MCICNEKIHTYKSVCMYVCIFLKPGRRCSKPQQDEELHGGAHGIFYFSFKYFSITCIILQQGHCKTIKIKISRKEKKQKKRGPLIGSLSTFSWSKPSFRGSSCSHFKVPEAAGICATSPDPRSNYSKLAERGNYFPLANGETETQSAVTCPRAHQQEVVALERVRGSQCLWNPIDLPRVSPKVMGVGPATGSYNYGPDMLAG